MQIKNQTTFSARIFNNNNC